MVLKLFTEHIHGSVGIWFTCEGGRSLTCAFMQSVSDIYFYSKSPLVHTPIYMEFDWVEPSAVQTVNGTS